MSFLVTDFQPVVKDTASGLFSSPFWEKLRMPDCTYTVVWLPTSPVMQIA